MLFISTNRWTLAIGVLIVINSVAADGSQPAPTVSPPGAADSSPSTPLATDGDHKSGDNRDANASQSSPDTTSGSGDQSTISTTTTITAATDSEGTGGDQSVTINATINRTSYVEPLVNDLPSVPTPAPPSEMLSFEEWRKKIAEKAVQQQQQQQLHQQNGAQLTVPMTTGQQAIGGQQTGQVLTPQGSPVGTQTSGQVTDAGSTGAVAQKPKSMGVQKRTRNFASNECGAKIVDSNPESESVLRILNEQTDEYMLNPCKAKIWFVVELCETVQPMHIELANFELYSSVPKEFNIQASDHYPTRDWSSLGTFGAQDERSVQRFPLQNTGFVKFIKVELLSHYGSEHFCPLSVVRVFGTSLFEEVERIDTLDANQLSTGAVSAVDEDESAIGEELVGENTSGQNLFGTARDAVYDIVRKAAQALNGNQKEAPESTPNETNTVPTNGSTDCWELFAIRLYPKVDKYLRICATNGNQSTSCLYLKALFGLPLYQLMIDQYMSVNNVSNPWPPTISSLFQCNAQKKETISVTNESINVESSLVSRDFESIAPTKPIANDWAAAPVSSIDSMVPAFNSASIQMDSVSTFARSTPSSTSIVPTHVVTSDGGVGQQAATDDHKESAVPQPLSNESTTADSSKSVSTNSEDLSAVPLTNTNNTETTGAASAEDTSANVTAPTTAPINGQQVVPANGQPLNGNANGYLMGGVGMGGNTKESVVIRLTNRIKSLEVNLSLSSQYLEQLSQRYRKQMEEMQRAFNITISKLNDTNIRAAERDLKQQESIAALETKLTTISVEMSALLKEREDLNWHYIEVHIALMMIEVIVVIVFLVIFGHRLSQRLHFAQTNPLSVNGGAPAALVSPNKRSHPYGIPSHLPPKTLKFEDDNKSQEVMSNKVANSQRKIRKKKRKTQAINGLNALSQSLDGKALVVSGTGADSLIKCGPFGADLSNEALIVKSQSTPALTVNTSLNRLSNGGHRPLDSTLDSNGRCSSCHSSTSGVSSNSTLSTNVLKTNHLPLNSSPNNEIKVNNNNTNSSKKSMVSRNKSSDNKSTNVLTLSLKKLLKFDRKMN